MKSKYFSPINILLLMFAVLNGCTTTIPERDFEPPKITLRFLSPHPLAPVHRAFADTYSNPPDGERLQPRDSIVPINHLIVGAVYRFELSAHDDGGVSELRIAMPTSKADAQVTLSYPEGVTFHTEGDQTVAVAVGSRSDPRSGLLIQGTFVVKQPTEVPPIPYFDIETRAADMGGRSGLLNRQRLRMRVGIELP